MRRCRQWFPKAAFVATLLVAGLAQATGTTRTCKVAADCGAREVCLFSAAGCPSSGKCVASPMCTRDLAEFCACDGTTFRGSSSCVEKAYKNRGKCAASTPTKCKTSADCASGQTCAGGEGCGAKWTCQAARPCTKDLREYCGCDGKTFRGSGTCPGQKYKHRGACGSEHPRRCTSSSDCRTGEGCYGPAGCRSTWVCAPARMCTRDLREFCGCDGTTFRGSSTCPGKKYKKTGACP